jgi:hypothetical protein
MGAVVMLAGMMVILSSAYPVAAAAVVPARVREPVTA